MTDERGQITDDGQPVPSSAPPGFGAADSRLEPVLARFEDAWRNGGRPDIGDYLPPHGPHDPALLVELVHIDLEYRLRAGLPVAAEDYLERYPELRAVGAELELAATESDLRRYFGARPEPLPRLGRFVILDTLGAGSFGTVYKALDTRLGRTVAVKVLHAGRLAGREERERFLREARGAARLRHPGLVAVHDAGQADGACYLVSEFVDGQTLARRLAGGRPTIRAAAELLAQVAEALDHAHRQGVVHRDLKPSNILLDRAGRPRVTDFGLAKHDAGGHTLAVAGEPLGTPAYMPPEQARGDAHRVDARGDVYSLGVILYEMLTGEPPFRGTGRMILKQVLEEEPRPPRRLRDDVPRDLENVCLKALAKRPAGRYPSALALADDLRRFLDGRPVVARPVGPARRLARWCRRRPVLAALALLAAAGFALVGWQWRRAEAHLSETVRQREQAFRVVSELLNTYDRIPAQPGELLAARREVLERAVQLGRSFLSQCGDDPHATYLVASAHKCLARTLDGLGRRDETLTELRTAHALFQELLRQHPAYVSARDQLADCHFELADWHRRGGLADAALVSYQRAIAAYEEIAGDAADATAYRKCLRVCWLNVGDLYRAAGRGAEAREADEQAVLLGTQLGLEDPGGAAVRGHVANFWHQAGRQHKAAGREADALRGFAEAAAHAEKTLETTPEDRAARHVLANSWYQVGDIHRRAGRDAESVPAFERALAAYERLALGDHSDQAAHQGVAHTHSQLGRLHWKARRWAAAAQACQQALRLWEEMCQGESENASCRNHLTRACQYLGDALDRLASDEGVPGDTAREGR